MNEENKEALASVRMIKEHCQNMDCDDCALELICDRYFTNETPGDWSIGALGATERKPIVYIKPMHGGKIPEKKSAGAAAWDCYARMDTLVFNGKTYEIPLGFALAMPEGVFATLIPRSSMGLKTGLCKEALHRLYGFGPSRLERLEEEMNRIMNERRNTNAD